MVPELNPTAFSEAIDHWLDMTAGRRLPDAQTLNTVSATMSRLSKGLANSGQTLLAVAGMQRFKSESQFSTFIARAQVFLATINDPDTSRRWAALGWLAFHPDGSGAVQARINLVKIAARCPLPDWAVTFDTVTFEELVRERFAPEELAQLARDAALGGVVAQVS
jgi:hypothetical protein